MEEDVERKRWIHQPQGPFSLLVNSAIPFKTAFSKKNDTEKSG
jgi:hypothetical protein